MPETKTLQARSSPSLLNLESETGPHFTAANTGDSQRPAVEILGYPSFLQRYVQESRAQRAADVRSPLTPIQTCERESATQLASGVEINAQRLASLRAVRRDTVCVIAAASTR